ncbi:MAG: family 16 glycosylhydrolase [Methylotetracoccus sp.]
MPRSFPSNKPLHRLLALAALSSAMLTAPSAEAGWQMTFSEEFNGTSLDTSKWITTDGWGNRGYAGNGELQCYMPDAFWFGGGVMSIVAQRQYLSVCAPPSQPGPTQYTSGMITTYGKFAQQYGYFEMRAQLPNGKGLWPAFWLLAADRSIPPELDIMEAIGSRPTQVFQAIHYNEGGQYKTYNDWWIGPDFTAGFHTYGLDWQPGYLAFYGDGVKRGEFWSGVIPNKPFYIVLNLALGGGWAGAPDGTTVFPARFQLDYVRAYQRVNNGQPDSVPPFGQVGGGGGGGTGGGTGGGSVSLMRSSSPDRSGASALNGATVSGTGYVFTTPDTNVSRIDFSLDGTAVRAETVAPYDFAGTATSTANPFNFSSLSAGTHTISALATFSNGTKQTASATFTVGSSSSSSGLYVSSSASRSPAQPLNNQVVGNPAYIYTYPDTGVSRVEFRIDGSVVKIENQAPFDMGGTGTSGALPFYTNGLSSGAHTLTAIQTLTNGTTRTLTATFYR